MRAFFVGLVVAGALLLASKAQAQDTAAMRDGAVADIADYFHTAERHVLLPGTAVPEILLLGPVETYTSSRAPQITLCSIEVLSLAYYLRPMEGRPASHVEPDRMLTNVGLATFYRVPKSPGDCATETPSVLSTLWFGEPDGSDMEGMTLIIALGLGLIDAIRAEAPTYEGLDVRSFLEATARHDIEALKRENAQRIGTFTWSRCDADEASFCRSAEIRFGVMGPVTDLSLRVRLSRPGGTRTWIESARVQAGAGPIP